MLTNVRESNFSSFFFCPEVQWLSGFMSVWAPEMRRGMRRGTHELDSWNMIKYLWALGHMPFWFHDVSSIRVKTSNTVLHRPLFLEGELSVYIHEMLLHTAGVLLQVNRVLQSAV